MNQKSAERYIIILITLLLLSNIIPLLAIEKSLSARGEISGKTYPDLFPNDSTGTRLLAIKLLRSKKYDEIEQAIQHYISSKSRNSNGDWNLLQFFGGLTNVGPKSSIEGFTHSKSRLDEWIKSESNSSNAKVAKALMLNSYAWKARGGGFSSSVGDEAWELFGTRLEEAYKLLVDSKVSSNPMWFNVVQKLATGLSMPKPNYYALIREAAKLHPEFDSIYINATWYLLPRWHGDFGEWQLYRDEVVANTSNDLRKDELYFLISRYALRFEGINRFEDQDVEWQKFKRGAEIRDAYFPSKANQSYMCLLSCILKDQESARRYFSREPAGQGFTNKAWERLTLKSLSQWRTWVLDDKPLVETMFELESFAKKGDAEAQYEFATALFFHKQSENKEGAMEILRKAAAQGHTLAKLRLETYEKQTKKPAPIITDWDITSGNMNLVKTKLEAGADPNVKVYAHVSALHWACEKGQLEIALMLLSRGAMPNLLNGARLTPLDLVSGPNKSGVDPLDRMSKGTQEILIEILEKNGAKTSEELKKPRLKSKNKE